MGQKGIVEVNVAEFLFIYLFIIAVVNVLLYISLLTTILLQFDTEFGVALY